jgi:hypothetical protein
MKIFHLRESTPIKNGFKWVRVLHWWKNECRHLALYNWDGL